MGRRLIAVEKNNAYSDVTVRWSRQGSRVVGEFSPRQINWLRRHFGSFREQVHTEWHLLAEEYGSEEYERGASTEHGPLAMLTGGRRTESIMEPGPGPRDLFFLSETSQAIDMAVAMLPVEGTEVRLRDINDVLAWIWSTYECAMALSARLGVAWQPLGSAGPGRREQLVHELATWLLRMIDDLIDVADITAVL